MNGVNKLTILRHLAAAGADVHLAPRWGGAAKMLLDLKCDPNERWRPARLFWKSFFKVTRNATAVAGTRWLEEFGMMSGASPLHFAAKRGDVAFTKMLIGAGAKVDLKNDEGHTPLEVAQQFFVAVPPLLQDALTTTPSTAGDQA